MALAKPLLGLLLLGFVLTINSADGNNNGVCMDGMEAVNVYMESRSCRRPKPRHMVRHFRASIQGNVTVHNLQNLFLAYCGTAFPKMMDCFQKEIQHCSADQREVLTTVASQTGFVCQPDSTAVHPLVTYLLSKVSDAQLAENEDCPPLNMTHSMFYECYDEAESSIGVSDESWSSVDNRSIQEVIPLMQRYSRRNFECLVGRIRDDKTRCPQWRRLAFEVMASEHLLPAELGTTMAFTEGELNRMFELQ